MLALIGRFKDYLLGLDLVDMVIGMVISWALADFTKELINQLMKPVTDKIDTLGTGDEGKKLTVFGAEIKWGLLMNKLFLVFMNLVFAFLIFWAFGQTSN